MLLKKGIIIEMQERSSEIVDFKSGNIVFNEDVEPSIKIIRKTDILDNRTGWNRLHLYLIVEDSAKEGDFIISNEESKFIVSAERDLENAIVLVATTDTKYLCARIPKWFIQEYAEKRTNGVYVQYEETNERLVPKKNKEHYIQFGNIERRYSIEEVQNVILSMNEELFGDEFTVPIQKWIDDNLK